MYRINIDEIDTDGAVREAADAVAGDTRLDFLRKAGIAGGSILAGGALLGAHVPPVDLCSAGALIALLALALQLVSMREAPIAAPNSAPSP